MKMAAAALVPVLCTLAFHFAEKKTPFQKLSDKKKQLVIGISFAALAILATQFGIPVNGAVMNVRNAAPLTAGLVFGWPAGILSGLIGGIERWFSPSGDYTRLACSISTIISGFLGAAVRRFMMDNKKVSWFYGLVVGVTSEVLHMLMVIFTNAADMQRAFHVVQSIAIPMIAANGLSVMLSMLVTSRSESSGAGQTKKAENISQTFQRWLLACVLLAFVATSIFIHGFQTRLSAQAADIELETNITDVKNDIHDASERLLLDITRQIKRELPTEVTQADVCRLAEKFAAAEISVVGPNGKVSSSSDPSLLGFDVASNERRAEFLLLLNDEQELVQEYSGGLEEPSAERKYAGIALSSGFLLVGHDLSYVRMQVDAQIKYMARNRHIGQNGSIIICDQDGAVVSGRADHAEEYIPIFDSAKSLGVQEGASFSAEIYGEESYVMYTKTEGYYIIGVLPKKEAHFARDASVYMQAFMEVLVFAVMFAFIFVLVNKLVVENVRRVNASLAQINSGNLDIKVEVRGSEEFASLSDDINATVSTLKHYITEAAARIDKELEFAKRIQHSALPSVFPPYPNRKEFSIYASMDTAAEVGGDFYDFYLLGEDKLAFLVADVSGNGVPAAMFMMRAKTLIKSFAESGMDIGEVFVQTNKNLCEGNDAGMFVTAWMGILDLNTGIVSYANAGHNPPAICRSGGEYEYLKTKANFVLAGMNGIQYRKNELQLRPGDAIFLYTDGVTEAQDPGKHFFGTARLLESLNVARGKAAEDICGNVLADVSAFAGESDQFDDITVLSVKFNGKAQPSTLRLVPDMNAIGQTADFLERELQALDAPVKVSRKMKIALDEIYSNIVKYSGADRVEIQCGAENGVLMLRFRDNGIPYDPLEAEMPDISLPVQERDVGGVGIFMVRRMMDGMEYMYKDGCNILTLTLSLQEEA